MNKRRAMILLCPFLTAFILLAPYFVFSYQSRQSLREWDSIAPSVTELSNNPLRPATLYANFFPLDRFRFVPLRRSFAARAAEASPLWIHMEVEPLLTKRWPQLAGRNILLFIARDGALEAVDFDRDETLWRVPVPAGEEQIEGNHPFFDREVGRVFFKTKRALHSVLLDGTEPREWGFDLKAVLPIDKDKESQEKIYHTSLWCRTGLAKVPLQQGSMMVFGCSSLGPYHFLRGWTGFLIGFPYNAAGEFERARGLRTWSPSPRGKNSDTGYNTGIYMSGAAPVVLPGGKLLVTTANGPSFPEEKNFPCALVRVDGESFSLDGANAWQQSAAITTTQCFAENLDLSSSGPSVLYWQNGLVGAVGGKDGTLKLFDPRQLKGRAKFASETFIEGRNDFGQVSLFPGADGSLRAVSARFIYGTFLESVPLVNYLKGDCVGFVSRQTDLARQVQYYFQDSLTRYLFSLPANAPERKLLTAKEPPEGEHFALRNEWVKGVWDKFEPVGEEFSLLPAERKPPAGWRAIPLASVKARDEKGLIRFVGILRADLVEEFQRRGEMPLAREEDFWTKETKRVIEDVLSGRWNLVAENRAFGAVWVSVNGASCQMPAPPGSRALYVEPRAKLPALSVPKGERAWHASGYRVRQDLSVENVWRFLVPGEELHHSNILTALSASGKDALVIIPALGTRKGSYVQLLDGNSGADLGQLPLPAGTHFSYPLVFARYLLVPTAGSGLAIFEARPTFRAWLRDLFRR